MDAVFQQALAFCQQRKYAQGIVLFDQILSTMPEHEASRYNRAKAHAKSNQLEKSLEDFDWLVNHHTSNADYVSERGVLYHHLSDSERAITDLDTAVMLEPNKPYRYSSRAFLKERIGDLQGALQDYEKAIELDPEDAITQNNKGLVEEKLGYMEQSKKSFKQADKIAGVDNSSYPTPPVTDDPKPEIIEQPKQVEEAPKKLTTKEYLKTIGKVVGDKDTRREFGRFLLSGFRKDKKE